METNFKEALMALANITSLDRFNEKMHFVFSQTVQPNTEFSQNEHCLG